MEDEILRDMLGLDKDADIAQVEQCLSERFGDLLDQAQEAAVMQDQHDASVIVVIATVSSAAIVRATMNDQGLDRILGVISDAVEMAYMLGKARNHG